MTILSRASQFSLIALAAAVSLAGAAVAQTSASSTVSVAGKDAATLHADIATAARKVCREEYRSDPYGAEKVPACVRAVVERTVSQLGDARLTAYHRDPGVRELARNGFLVAGAR